MARKQLKPTRREEKQFAAFAQEAVFEAEFLALVMEHPHTPDAVKGTIRFVLIAALDKLRAQMDDYDGDGQMIRDTLPHAAHAHPGFFEAFALILKDVERSAPRVVNSIQKHADENGIPPRYPHPLKEAFGKFRQSLSIGGKGGES